MNFRHIFLLMLQVCILLPLALFADVDTFGIRQIYPTKAGTRSWNSAHWANGKVRVVKYASDHYDPTDWTEDHSGGTDGFRIDGIGTMTMSGSGPRFHINSLRDSKTSAQFFRDVEFTAFYQRKGSGGQNYGGMVVGVRSGPLGHGSSGGNNCDATTYHARFRNDGKWDFEKELKHPGSTYWSGSGYNRQDQLWGGAKLPLNRWIGMKFIVFNIKSSNTSVKMDLYIDSVSNGNSANGGHWELVGTVTDSGLWTSGDVSGCGYEQSAIIHEGHGTLLMRTDGDTAAYKMVSVREIDPSITSVHSGPALKSRTYGQSVQLRKVLVDGLMGFSKDGSVDASYQLYTLQGKAVKKSWQADKGASKDMFSGSIQVLIAKQ